MFRNIDLQYIITSLPVLLISFTVHEIAHGFAAYRLGDLTAKNDGRLSLNPLRHIDPLGFILLLLAGFGWAKPVMINPGNLKDPKKDMAVISLAGPLINFLMSIVFFIPFYILKAIGANGYVMEYVLSFLQIGVVMNVSLAVFNFLPLPPLDGSKVFGSLLPDRIYYRTVLLNSRIGMGILLLLSLTGLLSRIISPMIESVITLYLWAATFISGLIH